MRFTVVICTLGRPGSLRATLSSLAGCDPLPDEILVVDGDPAGSAKEEVEAARREGLPVEHVEAAPGLTRQRNEGVRRATGDVVVFADDDISVGADTFARLADAYRQPGVVGACGRVDEADGRRVIGMRSRARSLLFGGGREGTFTRFGYPRRLVRVQREADVEFMPGCFMSARRSLAAELGFDERLPGYGLAEDEDFSYRLSRRGRIVYDPQIAIRHDNLGFLSKDRRRFSRDVVVNRAYLFEKNFPQTKLARLQFRLLLGLLVLHRLANGDLAGVRGVVEGAAELMRRSRSAGSAPAKAAVQTSVRVAFISSHAQRGGSERYLELLLDALDAANVRAVVSLQEGPLVERLRERGHAVDVIHTTAGWMSIFRSALRLHALLEATRPNVVHANGIKAALVAALATIGTGLPVVWVKHDVSHDGLRARLVARRCAQVVGVSRFVMKVFDGRDPARFGVVRTGIAPIRVQDEDIPDIVRLGPTILLVGRLDPRKGHEEVVAIAPAVVEAHPEARFLLVGGDDPVHPGYRAALQARIDAIGLNGKVVLTGYREDVAELAAGGTVGLICSVEDDKGLGAEGLPFVGLEFLSAGTPVVAYDRGGMAELLGPCGILVPPDDRDRLARALVELLSDPQRRERMSACGRARAAEEFTVEGMAAALMERYRMALNA